MKEGYKYWIGTLALIFLGMIFTVAGVGKLLAGSKAFEPFVSPGFLPQSFVEVIYIGLPYLEIIIGLLLILGILVKFSTSLASLLIIGFIASNILTIYLGGGAEPCGGCFGLLGGLTAISALAMDGIMAVMVAVILVCYRGNFFDISPWFLGERRRPKYV